MLFLGVLFDRNEEHLIAKKSRDGYLQNQANDFQWNCIDGLYENGIDNLSIINALPVGAYPCKYSDIIIPEKQWMYHGRKHFQLGSLNLPIFKQWGRYRACKKLLNQLNEKEILIYSAYYPFLKAIKKLDNSYNVTLIVPDLPEYYDYAKVGKVKRFLRKINNYAIKKCMRRVDRFVLLTEAMKKPLEVGNRPYTVVEGICAPKTKKIICDKTSNKKVIFYAGSLNKQFGLDVLLEAFHLIQKDDYELWLCGAGDYQDEIKRAAEKDSRIKFWGFVTKDKILELQSMATVLVNPRQNNAEYTKYSFPSKTIEYLLSGIPVVAYRLDGIPDEYNRFINSPKDNTSQSLSKLMMDICDGENKEYESISLQAIDFVLNKKNSKMQSLRIIKLMRGADFYKE